MKAYRMASVFQQGTIVASLLTAALGGLWSASARAADQVWVYEDNNDRNSRYDSAGGSLGFTGAANANGYNCALAMVGNRVWLYEDNNDRFWRYDFTGAGQGFHSGPNANGYSTAIVVLPTEVWLYEDNNDRLWRFNYNGVGMSYHNSVNANGYRCAMAIAGNEVWLYEDNNDRFWRYNFNGGSLGFYSAVNSNGYSAAMATTSSEVWLYEDNNDRLWRYNFSGGSAGFVSGPNSNGYGCAMTATKNEVWLYEDNNDRIWRYNFSGGSLPFIGGPNANGYNLAMTFITEPDCNSNGVSDYIDISGVTSDDCNTDLIPDECDIAGVTSDDCNTNAVPDECDPDCNNNDHPDDCDLLAMTSADCNANNLPDDCDIAGPASDDCNTNQIPDECDISAATSADCNENSIADECESGSGDIYWAGPDGGQFQNAAYWNPAVVPLSAGNAIFENSSPTDNRCIVDSTPGPICSLAIQATGSGRQIVQINSGVTLETNSGATVSPGGDIRLEGGELAGGAIANTSDSITGYGTVSANLINAGHIEGESFRLLSLTSATLDNQTGGSIVTPLASGIEILSSNVQQGGEVEIHAIGACRFTEAIFNAPGGSITLLGGAIGSRDVDGLENGAGASITGTGTIDCTVANNGEMVVIADMLVVGDLANEGTITIQSGLLTVTGDVSGGGTIIGGFGGRDGQANGVVVQGDFLPSITDWRGFDLSQAVLQVDGGSVGEPQHLEVISMDRGDAVGLTESGIHAIGTLRIGPTPTTVRLVDRHKNAVGSRQSREALYVGRLIIEPGAALDLAGMNVYFGQITPRDLSDASGAWVTDSVGGGSLQHIRPAADGARKSKG